MRRGKNLNLVIAAILWVLVLCGSSRADLTDGLVAHWTFDEGSGNMAYDAIGGNDGIIYGAQWVEGLFGGALGFDGNGDYISILENTLPEAGPYSISLWLYKDGNYQSRYVVGGHDQNACWIHYYINDNARFTVGSKNRGSGRTVIRGADNQTFENYRPANDQWIHVVVVFDSDGKTVKLYRDAFDSPNYYMVYSGYTDPGWGFYGTDTVIGRLSSGSAYYNGLMDDVRIYNKALSESEVQQLYRGQLVGLEIVGPNEVAENFQAQYKAIAHYDNGGTADVTVLSDWSVEPNNNCGIAAGLLTTEVIDLPQDVTITAQYSEGDINETAEKDVSILTICPSGSALDFDGTNDYIMVGDKSSLELQEFSLSFWGQLDNLSGDYKGGIAKGYVFGAPSEFSYRMDFHNGYLRAGITNTDNVAFGNFGNYHSVGDNNWHMWTMTVGNGNLNIYKDGILKGSYTYSGMIDYTKSHNNFIIGARDGGNYFFDGKIDEVIFFNKALSAEEIRALMHTKLAGDEDGLVGYWDFDEGEGEIAGDSSGNGNDGAIVGAAWVQSDAPVGICSFEGLIERNLLRIYDMKQAVLDTLEKAMVIEEATKYLMDEGLKNGSYGDLNKGDVVKAKQKIHSAIQHEEQAETSVDRSIDKLDDALNTLGIE